MSIYLSWRPRLQDQISNKIYVTFVLSHQRSANRACSTPNLICNVCIRFTFGVALARELYFTSMLDLEIYVRLIFVHSMMASYLKLNQITMPYVDCLSSVQRAQST